MTPFEILDNQAGALPWLNLPRGVSQGFPKGISTELLRGKITILDFWTYCCINCMHILPTLKRVEERFPDSVVVLGIHSPKFDTERDLEHLRQAVLRYGIGHPVVQDTRHRLWEAFGVGSWPTLVFLGPDGEVMGQSAGELDPDKLLLLIQRMLDELRDTGSLRPRPLVLAPQAPPSGRLRFPGKIKPVPEEDGVEEDGAEEDKEVNPGAAGAPCRWAVADAGHHQIVLLSDDGMELRRFGSGRAGFSDGPAEEASFNGPQGLVASADTLYVADTGNHALRAIDLAGGAVTTLAGINRRGQTLLHRRPAAQAVLASPWDLALDLDRLLFANAGTHQLGVLDLLTGLLDPLAGTGGEGLLDGPALEAAMAQPSGLAFDPETETLFVADSETSSLRAVDRGGSGQMVTLVGSGLFDFGATDGDFRDATMQHALGVAWLGRGADEEAIAPTTIGGGTGRLAVADSYNNAVRLVDLGQRRVSTLALSCLDAECRPMHEPAGICAAGPTRLLVSDTNNHRILEIDCAAGTMRTWFA